MQLGDWVEFDTIVVKNIGADSSTPAAFSLGRTRSGVVIGERSVYDVAFGTPPVLSNRRQVLLVAVSLHRCYRVFHADARPGTPLRPRQRRAAAQPAIVSTLPALNGSGGTAVNGRTMLAQSAIDTLVADQLNQHMANNALFTAYDVTSALRDANPHAELPHAAVRDAVHAQMEAIVQHGLYDREQTTFGNGTAWQYVPLN